MRIVTSGFKDALIESGREFDCQIIYTIDETTTTLGLDNIYNVNYSYKASILKSIMKQLEFESDENIPLKTNLEYRIGLKVNDAYEYISYGTFIVKEVEYKEDTNTYLYTCYDKMLYAMTDYVDLGITYPITIRAYISAICSHLGLTFKNANSTFTNYDRQIPSELYLDSDGNTLYYSFRDVLDELAQVTASCICINEDDGQLEVRYPITRTGVDNNYLKDTNIKKTYKEYGPINCVELCRSADSDMIYEYDEISEKAHGLTTIRISNNQILNGEDRENYLHEIYERVEGITYSICDLSSYGILFYDLLDKFPISWTDDNNETHTINVLMLNDDIMQNQMVEERIQIEEPLTAFIDYGEKTKEVKNDNRAKIEVDKVNARLNAKVSKGEVMAEMQLEIDDVTNESIVRFHSNKFILEADNCSIDEYGNASFNDAILTGGNLTLQDDGTQENASIKIETPKRNYDPYTSNMQIDGKIIEFSFKNYQYSDFTQEVLSRTYLLMNYNWCFRFYLINNNDEKYLEIRLCSYADETNIMKSELYQFEDNILKDNLDFLVPTSYGSLTLTASGSVINSNDIKYVSSDIVKTTTYSGEGIEAQIIPNYNYDTIDIYNIELLINGGTPTELELEKYDIDNDGEITENDLKLANLQIEKNITQSTPGHIKIDTQSISDNIVLLDGNNNKVLSIGFDGIIYNNNRILVQQILYNNTSGSSSTITLSDDASNYNYIEIIYGWEGGIYGYTSSKIHNPQGKIANLTSYALNNNQLYIASSQWTINNNTITSNMNEYWVMKTNGYPTRNTNGKIKIVRVVGYK